MEKEMITQNVVPLPEVTETDVMTEEVWKKIRHWTELKDTYHVVGTRVTRLDAKSKVTGKARYVEDIILPNMLYGKILRSPHAHARIISIDTSRAERLPGVKAVLTAKNSPEIYMFGIGTDFRKLKYPFVWYDVLHVADVLSRYPFARPDPRFGEMLGAVTAQADEDGRYTASSIYRAWKDWSFADKKNPSPWLTYLAMRIQRRANS